MYLYEYNEDCEPVDHPRHCLPYAAVTYKKSRTDKQKESKSSGYQSNRSRMSTGFQNSTNVINDNINQRRGREKASNRIQTIDSSIPPLMGNIRQDRSSSAENVITTDLGSPTGQGQMRQSAGLGTPPRALSPRISQTSPVVDKDFRLLLTQPPPPPPPVTDQSFHSNQDFTSVPMATSYKEHRRLSRLRSSIEEESKEDAVEKEVTETFVKETSLKKKETKPKTQISLEAYKKRVKVKEVSKPNPSHDEEPLPPVDMNVINKFTLDIDNIKNILNRVNVSQEEDTLTPTSPELPIVSPQKKNSPAVYIPTPISKCPSASSNEASVPAKPTYSATKISNLSSKKEKKPISPIDDVDVDMRLIKNPTCRLNFTSEMDTNDRYSPTQIVSDLDKLDKALDIHSTQIQSPKKDNLPIFSPTQKSDSTGLHYSMSNFISEPQLSTSPRASRSGSPRVSASSSITSTNIIQHPISPQGPRSTSPRGARPGSPRAAGSSPGRYRVSSPRRGYGSANKEDFNLFSDQDTDLRPLFQPPPTPNYYQQQYSQQQGFYAASQNTVPQQQLFSPVNQQTGYQIGQYDQRLTPTMPVQYNYPHQPIGSNSSQAELTRNNLYPSESSAFSPKQSLEADKQMLEKTVEEPKCDNTDLSFLSQVKSVSDYMSGYTRESIPGFNDSPSIPGLTDSPHIPGLGDSPSIPSISDAQSIPGLSIDTVSIHASGEVHNVQILKESQPLEKPMYQSTPTKPKDKVEPAPPSIDGDISCEGSYESAPSKEASPVKPFGPLPPKYVKSFLETQQKMMELYESRDVKVDARPDEKGDGPVNTVKV